MKKKSIFILLLLISSFGNINLKKNLLSSIPEAEEEEEDPVLMSNLSVLRNEASNIVRKLFGFSYSFSAVAFDREVTIYSPNPKITAKLSSKCDVTFSGKNTGIIKIKGGTVISQSGINSSVSNPIVSAVLKLIGFDIKKWTVNLEKKFKTATTDGTVSFKISLTKIEISVTVKKSKGNSSCDGTITFTISPGNPLPQQEAIENALQKVAASGAIAIAVIVLFKLAKGVAFGAVGGPVGFALGVAS